MDFYLDVDLRQGRMFIIPMIQKKSLYVIEVAHRGEGDKLLSDLNFGRMKGPLVSPDNYEIIESIDAKFGKLQGIITVYKLKPCTNIRK